MNWPCEHFTTVNACRMIIDYTKQLWPIGLSWRFCPICGAKRPPEKVKLWEKFMKKMFTQYPDIDETRNFYLGKEASKVATQIAIEHIKEIVDELQGKCYAEKIHYQDLGYELKRRLDKELE